LNRDSRKVLTETEPLIGDKLLPGLSIPLATFFAKLATPSG
jgi:hypothetical protein